MKRPLRLVRASVLLSCLALPTAAHAVDGVDELEKNLGAEHAALSTSDCSLACRALSSIRRAADKICALEPGRRCAEARAKAEDGTRRVREACPDCAIAVMPTQPSPEPHATPSSETVASSPPHGGCASCDASGMAPGDWSGGALAVLALARLLRRRRLRGG